MYDINTGNWNHCALHMVVKTQLWHVHKAKTTESKQRQHYLYHRTEEYKQVAICDWAASLSSCSAWLTINKTKKTDDE